jgi:hypothetical protein
MFAEELKKWGKEMVDFDRRRHPIAGHSHVGSVGRPHHEIGLKNRTEAGSEHRE